ncbi:MAG: alpha/beta hydrolase [Vulcanimicrobiota bacterium]
MGRLLTRCLALLMGLPGVLLLVIFVDGRSRLLAAWLALGGIALWRARPLELCLWLLSLSGLALQLPAYRWGRPIGNLSSFGLCLSPLNLVSERDLSSLGIGFFYGGSRRVQQVVEPVFQEMESRPQYALESVAVPYALNDLFGLGTGSGHLYYFAPQRQHRKLLLFLHGAMGNLKCYTSFWQTWAEHNGYSVVCPTFGFGFWMRPGGLETAVQAFRYAHQNLEVAEGGCLLIGLSNGSTGAVRLTLEHPEMVEQLVLISPVLETELVGSLEFARALKHPPLIFEGDEDLNVRPESVERGIAAMRAAGIRPDYRLLPGHDHFLMFSARSIVFEGIKEISNPINAQTPPVNK